MLYVASSLQQPVLQHSQLVSLIQHHDVIADNGALPCPAVMACPVTPALQPGYLGSQGLAARGLLTGADAAVSMHGGVQDATPAQASDDSSTGLLDDMSAWAADCVEGLGHAVVRLGRWMRRTVSGQQGEEQAASSSAASANSRAAEDGAFLRRVGGGAVAVVAAMVAIIAVALLKKGRR